MSESLKLSSRLNELFRHCEYKCTATCCYWDAFDFSAHWVGRWCEFLADDDIQATIAELVALEAYSTRIPSDPTVFFGFHATREQISSNLARLRSLLSAHLDNQAGT